MKLEISSEPVLQTPQQISDRIYHKFLKVINEPLSKDQRNPAKDELLGILNELKHQAFDVLMLFTFILALFFVLLLLAFPTESWVIVLFVAFALTYSLLFLSSLIRHFISALKNVFKPWNEYIFHETLSRQNRPDKDIEAIKTRLTGNFALEELALIQSRAKQDFEKNNDKLKDAIDFLTKCIVICTIVSGITKEFAGSGLPTSRIILIYGLCFGGVSIIVVLYRLIREMKFDKLLTSIERSIDYWEGVENKFNSAG